MIKKLFGIIMVCLLTTPVQAVQRPHGDWRVNTLAGALVAEAGGEGRIGMEAVVEVLLNRAYQENKRLESVMLSFGVLSSLNKTTPTALYLKGLRQHPKAMKVALQVAAVAFQNPKAIPRRVKGATFYENKAKPKPKSWPANMIVVAVIGNHRFWKLH